MGSRAWLAFGAVVEDQLAVPAVVEVETDARVLEHAADELVVALAVLDAVLAFLVLAREAQRRRDPHSPRSLVHDVRSRT